MKTLFDHLEHVKGKPHHVRKRIAFGMASGGTALIALVWFASAFSTGEFTLHGSSFAQSTTQGAIVVAGAENQNQNLAGAAAALPPGGGQSAADAPAHIEIVDAASSTPAAKQAEATVIPF